MSLTSPTKLDAAVDDDEPLSPTGSEADGDPVTNEEYSARMDEIMDSDDDDGGSENGFIYDGVDAPQLGRREKDMRMKFDDEETSSVQREGKMEVCKKERWRCARTKARRGR